MRKETKAAADAVAEEINSLLSKVVRKKIYQTFEELESAFKDHSIRDNVMKCRRCKLRVTGILSSAECPNNCGPLHAVTWKEECLEAEAHAEQRLAKQPEYINSQPDEVKPLVDELEKLAKVTGHEDDCTSLAGENCNCGADAHNTKVRELAACIRKAGAGEIE